MEKELNWAVIGTGVIANEMAVNIRTTSGPAIEKPGDLVALLRMSHMY